jgi:AAA+ superfamily predicted ATPase
MSDSVESLREAVRALPENLALRRQLAAALERAQDFDAAAGEYDAIIARASDDAAAHMGRARCLYEIGRHVEALAAYELAVDKDVALADAALLGRIRAAKDDPRARIRLVADGGDKKPPGPLELDEETPQITFADVGGLEELKEKIRLRLIYPLKRPDLYRAFGKKVGGGLLLYGPPGCGKTFLARATAGEAGLSFIAVGIEEVLDMWLGQSEKKLHEFFAAARDKAPTILFFDEVDSLGGRRSGLRHESYRTLVTQFLSELDGAGGEKSQKGVLVIGATNAPWDVDPAFRRPGRFGEVLFVPPPDLRARVEILKLKLAGKPVAADLDVAELARLCELFSGADLEHVVEAATEVVLAESLRGGAVRNITAADLRAAQKKVKPTTLEWFSTAKNFATYANESGQFDDVLDYLKRHRL